MSVSRRSLADPFEPVATQAEDQYEGARLRARGSPAHAGMVSVGSKRAAGQVLAGLRVAGRLHFDRLQIDVDRQIQLKAKIRFWLAPMLEIPIMIEKAARGGT